MIGRQTVLSTYLFLINPLVALIVSFFQKNQKVSRNILWAFIVFYGLTFYIPGETSDSATHIREYQKLAAQNDLKFTTFVQSIYTEEADVLIPFLKYFISRFTDSKYPLIISIAIIFGYFFSRNIFFLISYSRGKLTWSLLLILITYSVIYGPWSMNAFRFPIAVHIYIYGIVNFFTVGEKKYLALLMITPLIHFSFIIACTIFIIYLYLGDKLRWYSIIFFLSALSIPLLSTSDINNILPQTEVDAIEKRRASYLNENYILQKAEKIENTNWYVSARVIALEAFVIIVAIILFIKEKKIGLTTIELKLFCISLFMMSIINFLKGNIGSIGRFGALAQILFLAGLFIFLTNRQLKLSNLLVIPLSLCLLLYVIVEFRIGFYSATLDLFLSNPIIALFIQTELSLENFISLIR